MKRTKNDLVIGLEENAFDSLEHGIQHFVQNKLDFDLKYALLHVFQAVELFLKARLAKEHKMLIFKDPAKTGLDAPTVDFDNLLQRLKTADVKFSDQDLKNFKAVQKYRNQIQHYQIETSYDEVERIIGQAVRFLEKFLSQELEIDLRNTIDEDTYRVLSEAIYSFEERVQRAEEQAVQVLQAHHEMDQSLETCPFCYHLAVPILSGLRSGKTLRCYFCHSSIQVEKCHRCGNPVLEGQTYCDYCQYQWDKLKYE